MSSCVSVYGARAGGRVGWAESTLTGWLSTGNGSIQVGIFHAARRAPCKHPGVCILGAAQLGMQAGCRLEPWLAADLVHAGVWGLALRVWSKVQRAMCAVDSVGHNMHLCEVGPRVVCVCTCQARGNAGVVSDWLGSCLRPCVGARLVRW